MRGGEIVLDGAMHRADDHVGEPREGLARLLGRDGAGEDARADQEHVLLAELARAVEQVLVGARLRQRAGQFGRELLGVRQRAEERRLDQRIHHLRIARQNIGEPRRGAEHEREQRDEIRIAPQQRQQPRAAMQAGEEAVERDAAR